MKRYFSLLLVSLMALSLCSCGSETDDSNDAKVVQSDSRETDKTIDTFEPTNDASLALITDVGNIDDHTFNQSCWEAVVDFAERCDVTYNYYLPEEDSTTARIESIRKAIRDGATVCICPGNLFEEVLYTVQYEFPNIQFLLLDGEPRDVDYNYDTASNVHCILYKEEEAGYMAGYAAVMDGMTQLGFVGGMAIDAVLRYGYGFIQGADAAAEESNTDITINYWYADTFQPNDTIYNTTREWYNNGTQVIFACGGNLGISVIKAAQELGTFVIGVDRDLSYISDNVITSATKQLYTTCTEALEQLRQNNWIWPDSHAGSTALLGADDNAVALPTSKESWRFTSFTTDIYQTVLAAIASGNITISDDISEILTTGKHTTVNYLQ